MKNTLNKSCHFCCAYLLLLFLLPCAAIANAITANPDNYRSLIKTLQPGDTLLLQTGVYHNGLPIHHLLGTADQPITIRADDKGLPPLFVGKYGSNTISIIDSAYVTISGLKLDGRNLPINAVKAEGHGHWTHHITIEKLVIRGYGMNQQTVGISTKCPSWGWVVRENIIDGAGTGMYFGNADGTDAFVGGLIEHNLVVNTLGYNLQIKHQKQREAVAGMPGERQTTIIRHNVFSKAQGGGQQEMARPNVLVGHFPLTGAGSEDSYAVYGNVFFQNPDEALFQGEGNIGLYSNLFFNSYANEFPAIAIQPHHDIPRRVRIFFNTVLHPGKGIRVLRREQQWVDDQEIIGNAVFSETPLQGGRQVENFTYDFLAADEYLHQPVAELEKMDLSPSAGRLTGTAIDLAQFKAFPEYDRDFNGMPRSGDFRGAYSGSVVAPLSVPMKELLK